MIRLARPSVGVALQQVRQSRFGVGGLSSRELRLRECPQIVAIAALNRNRVLDPFDRLRVLAAFASRRAPVRTGAPPRPGPPPAPSWRETYRPRRSPRSRERPARRSRGKIVLARALPLFALLHRVAPLRHAVGVQDVVQSDNPHQLAHVRAADDGKNIQSAGSHLFECQAQAVVGMNVWEFLGGGIAARGNLRRESPQPSDSTLRRLRPVRARSARTIAQSPSASPTGQASNALSFIWWRTIAIGRSGDKTAGAGRIAWRT